MAIAATELKKTATPSSSNRDAGTESSRNLLGSIAVSNADLDRQLLEQAWDNYTSSRFVAPAVAVLIVLLAMPTAPLWSLLVFGGWAAAAYAFRLVVDRQWRKRGPGWRYRQSRRWLYVVHVVTSIVWGLAPLLILYVDVYTQFVIGMIICTVAVTGTFDSAAEANIQHANVVIEMAPLIAVTAYMGAETNYLISGLLAIFAAYLLYVTQKQYHRIRETLTLQIERTELIDRLRQALVDAESSGHAKSRFLANMSHELRTPLNGILGFAQMIGHLPPGKDAMERHREYAGLIEQSGGHLLNLINDLLDIAKAEAGRMELHREWTPLQSIVRDATLLIGPLAADKSITIDHDPALRRQQVFGDAQRLKQAVINLLSNAIKFTDQGGTVAISWRSESQDGPPAIIVTDTGVGMTESQIHHAVQPFEQVANADAWQPQGTGLGLPIVRLIAEAHGGELTFVSAPAQGTSAIIEFDAEAVRSNSRVTRRA